MTYLSSLTTVHTIISLIAIVTGAGAVIGLFREQGFRTWTRGFLITATATSVTGFFFPFRGFSPAVIVGIVAIVILAVVLVAFYRFRLARAWRWIYAAGMVASLYLLVFVGVVQAFQKISVLHAFAPTQSEAPFVVAQVVTLVVFLAIGVLAARDYQPGTLDYQR